VTGHDSDVAARPFATSLVAQATADSRIVCVTNDLTNSCEADEFRASFPERFLSLGMAEQNIAGVLSGLAREGMIPVYPTFAVFATRRPYEQIALNIAYPALPVRIFGFLPGLLTPGGPTHQAIDDLALMRQLPNMTVIEVADATEIETFWDAAADVPGPIYCRMLRGDVPRRFDDELRIGAVRTLSAGNDAVLITSGRLTEIGADVVEHARSQGVHIAHLHLATIKPFPADAVSTAIRSAKFGVVTAENHLRTGGIGTAVSEIIAERALGKRLIRLGIDDIFGQSGSLDFLFRRYGMTGTDIAAALSELIPNSDLVATYSEKLSADALVQSDMAVEAL
jgi:transketolase